MQDGEPNVYAAIATLRNGYVQGQWSRLQMFLTFNAIAIPIVIGTKQTELVNLLLSVAGVLVHYAVLLGAIRANDWIKYWDKKLKELEELDINSENSKVRVAIFSDPDFGSKRQSKWATRFSFIPLAILVVGFWVTTLLYNAYLLVR